MYNLCETRKLGDNNNFVYIHVVLMINRLYKPSCLDQMCTLVYISDCLVQKTLNDKY